MRFHQKARGAGGLTFRRCAGGALAIGLVWSTLLGGKNSAGGAVPSSAANPVAAHGRALYAQHCLACHGPSGRGDGTAGRDLNPEPADLLQPDVLDKTDAQLVRQIARGRRPMPSFQKLPVEDRRAIVGYIRTLAAGTHAGDAR